jgi:hypothetical protein
LGRAKEKSGHGEMNNKHKQPSLRKYRYLRRGWGGEGKKKIREQINRDYFDIALETVNWYHFHKRIL